MARADTENAGDPKNWRAWMKSGSPFGKQLPWIGLAWLVFPLWIYIFAVVKPIVNALKGGSALTYLETNGIIDAGIFYLLGIVIFFIMRYRARSAGVDEKMLFTELPPD